MEAIAPVEVDVPVEAEAPQAVDDWGAPEADTAYTGEAAPDATSEYTEPPAEATAEASERSGWESETPVAAADDAWAAEAPVAETAVAEATPESTSDTTGSSVSLLTSQQGMWIRDCLPSGWSRTSPRPKPRRVRSPPR